MNAEPPDILLHPLVTEMVKWSEKTHSAVIVVDDDSRVLFASETAKTLGVSLDDKLSWVRVNENGNQARISIITQGQTSPVDFKAFFINFEFQNELYYLIVIDNPEGNLTGETGKTEKDVDLIFSLLPGMAYRCANDQYWTMEYLSDKCQELTGYSPEELIGNNEIPFSELIHPEDQDRVWDEIQEALSDHRSFTVAYRLSKKTGEPRWFQEQGREKLDADGNPDGIEGWIIDITKQKTTEEELRKSEILHQSLLEGSPDAVVLVDLKGVILQTNDQFSKMFDAPSVDALVGKDVVQYLAPRTRKKSLADIIKKLSNMETHQGKYQAQSLSGKTFPVEVSMRAVPNPGGKVDSYLGIVRDISDVEESLQALRNSAAYYRAIVEDNPEMIVRFTQNGTVTFANLAYADYYGLDRNVLMGSNLVDVLPESSRETIKRILEFVSQDMKPSFKEVSVKKEKETRWYRWKTTSIRDESGTFIEYQSVGEDITDEKNTEEARFRSEKLLRELMENIKLIALIMDLNGNVTFCNSHYLELSGYGLDEVIGHNWMENFVPFDVAVSLRKLLLGSAINGLVPQRVDNLILTKNGETRLVAWNNTLLRNHQGEVNAIASIGDDITEKYFTEKTQEAIYKISQSVNESEDLDNLYFSIHQALKGLMPAENFFIGIYDDETKLLAFPYYVDPYDEQPSPKPLGHGLSEYIMRTGKTQLVNPEVFNLLIEEKEADLIGTPPVDWLGAPLKVGSKVIGVIGTQTYSTDVRLKKRDEQMLGFVSTQVAMAIDRKRSDQELRKSKQRNELLIQASTDGIVLESLDGDILDCNPVFEHMYGYTKEELLKMKVADLVPTDYLADKKDYVRWELEQGGYLAEVPNLRRDGTEFPVEVSTRLTNIEESQFVVAYVRDITERKKAERAIAESEQKFRTLAETAAAGIFIHSGSKFLYVNPAWCQITGYTEEELLKINFWDVVLTSESGTTKELFNAKRKGDIVHSRFEKMIVTRSGEKKWLDVSIGRIDFEGNIASIGTAVDISSRKLREHELEVVAQISEALRISLTREEVHQTILHEIMNLMDIEGALVSTLEGGEELYLVDRGIGCWKPLDYIKLRASEGLCGYILTTNKPYLNNSASTDPYFAFPEYLKDLTAVAGVSLIAKGEPIGVILVGAKHDLNIKDMRLLKAIADLAAGAVHRSDLFDQTLTQARELKTAYDATLEGWAFALELRDKETQGHSIRIANMTLKLAKRMGYVDAELDNIWRGALLHDIGKMGIPDTILLKPSKLTGEEWQIMQQHPVYAYEMLADLPNFKGMLDIPYCHHEWWDGTGYPRGLSGTDIPLSARIFAIVDAWDALISDRPYRKAWMQKDALAHIVEQSGTHFDPDVVSAFTKMIAEDQK